MSAVCKNAKSSSNTASNYCNDSRSHFINYVDVVTTVLIGLVAMDVADLIQEMIVINCITCCCILKCEMCCIVVASLCIHKFKLLVDLIYRCRFLTEKGCRDYQSKSQFIVWVSMLQLESYSQC